MTHTLKRFKELSRMQEEYDYSEMDKDDIESLLFILASYMIAGNYN